MEKISVFDIPDAIKKASSFFVDGYGILQIKYNGNNMTPINIKINNMTAQTYRGSDLDKDVKYNDILYIINAKDKYGLYCILSTYINEYDWKQQENFFLFIIDDFKKIKDNDDRSLDQIKEEILKEKNPAFSDFIFSDYYSTMESPELYKIIDHWFDLTNGDFAYNHQRFITV